jgi:TolB-like protein/tetratricopeptide (TPR) repeat protein
MTDAERHARAKSVFLEVIAQPVAMRAAALERACEAEPEVRGEVESLLAHADTSNDASALGRLTGEAAGADLASGAMFTERYRIVASLGCGSMGDVYRAVDTTLDVDVALKILHGSSPAAIDRLLAEVRLARQVTHPAICRVYDVAEHDGRYFLTMELVDGEDLASLIKRIGRLPAEKVREIGAQLCRGLAAAHDAGVLHRDLKPSNVMLDGAGAVRVTDFGVAVSESDAITAPVAGTPAFLAPEQLATGAPPSAQTDLYAVGLVLHEALHGALPDAPGAAIQESSDVSLDAVIRSLLSPDPADRPRSAEEVAIALEGPRAGPPVAVPAWAGATSARWMRRGVAVSVALLFVVAVVYGLSDHARSWLRDEPPLREQLALALGPMLSSSDVGIAVLPIADESEGGGRRHMAKAVKDLIIDRLSRVNGLRVIAEDSTKRFRPDADVRVVGRELGIDFVVSGRLTGRDDNQRVDVTLHDATTGAALWTEAHEGVLEPDRAYAMERDVTKRILESIATDIADAGDTIAHVPTIDSDVYALYLRGREHVPPFTEREFLSSINALKQVVATVPGYAPAHEAIATAYVTASMAGWIDPNDGYPMARRYAARALELDSSAAEAHEALAIVAGDYDWDWHAAEAGFERAIAIRPCFARAHRSRARFLSSQGRTDEALEATRRAIELDPTSALMMQGAAQRFYEARQYERAAGMARIAIRLDPLYPFSYATLGFILLEQGGSREAIEQFRKMISISGGDSAASAALAYAYGRAGRLKEARATADELLRRGPPNHEERSVLALATGDEDTAVESIAAAVAARAPPSIWLAVRPIFDPLRERDDFQALVSRVGLTAMGGDVVDVILYARY